jgi:ubiquinone/menaquinone biosynthesis C-methylase UbiE
MRRVPEPELMNDAAQAHAYAHADFAEPHQRFVELFKESFPGLNVAGRVLDLGCGPADVTIRFARAFPECTIEGVDGAESMLHHGAYYVGRAGLKQRIHLVHARLPHAQLPARAYDVIISNSLLHHLHDPMVLWQAIKSHAKPGAAVFVMDLLRPQSREQAQALVDQYAAGEPDILRQDFFNSLLAAFRVDEVGAQLRDCNLLSLETQQVSDRHLIVRGHLAT